MNASPPPSGRYVYAGILDADEEDWRRLAAQGKLSKKTIHDFINMDSGSPIRKRQFTIFRALWPTIDKYDALFDDLSVYALHVHLPAAEQIVTNSPGFNRYLDIVDTGYNPNGINENHNSWAGPRMLVASLLLLSQDDPNST